MTPSSWRARTRCRHLAALPCDVVLNGVTGAAGLRATLAALEAGRTLALANKESLIIGGPLVTSRAKPGQIVPVDSEHSTIAQCLRAGAHSEVKRLVLTASGGPFRGWPAERLASVTPEQALAHPTWNMGPLVTTNSATLVNKGLEVIEAHLLFGFGLDRIDVVVHPQSIVHSMVEFADGATIIQASPPDMRIPIALGLAWPDRVADAAPGLDWTTAATWTFEPLDERGLPRRRAGPGGRPAAAAPRPPSTTAPTRHASADFLAGSISFPRIVDTVARVVSEHDTSRTGVTTLDDVLAVDAWARARARELTRSAERREERRLLDVARLADLPCRPDGLGHAARDRALRGGQAVRHEVHAATSSASARRSGPPSAARPSTASRRCRSAASSRSSA